MTGFDQTWMVQDQISAGDREVKYTVDAVGTELLLYPDSVAPVLRARDRSARRRSRTLAALPGQWRSRIVRATGHAAHLAHAVNERLLDRRSLPTRGSLVPVGSALRPRWAAAVSQLDADDETHQQRATVVDTLRRSGVAPVVLPAGPGKDASVAVRGQDAEHTAAALADGLDRSWYAVPLDASAARPRRVTRSRVRQLCATDGGFRLFRLTAGGPGRPITAAEVGIDVEVWREPQPTVTDRTAVKHGTAAPGAEADRRLAAPRRQAWTNRLTDKAWHEATARPAADLPVPQLPHLFAATGPIDVVYTWVDGADPDWNEQRATALGSPRDVGLLPAATHAARFRSHDELRYSLRSLEMFAPWVRTVHVVTAGQVPYWLETAHPRLNLVDHREIFADPAVLPVFNSHAIESQLHRIPGLAERYLYLNDDVFFGRPVTPELFFHGNGLAKFFPSSALIDHGPREPHDDPVTSAAKNNRDLIEDVFGRTTTTIFQHTPHPQLRSVLEHMEDTHPELFAQVAASKFRHPDDLSITSALHHYYAYGLGKAVPGRLEYLYLNLGHPGAARRLQHVLGAREFDVFCLNDSPDVSGEDEDSGRLLRAFLSRYFPLASSFERGIATTPLDDVVQPHAAPRRLAAQGAASKDG
ncbi:stealth family protein [Georgenia sunbinii]|uniref:stealth family protein n=1 Tax=Georgenia sunbinii TaxID=3117728 RepID=UPI002F2613F7